MANKAVGYIETNGLTSCVVAADAAVKNGNVTLLGYEYAKGGGLCTVKVEGDVGAVKAAIAAGKRAADSVSGSHIGARSVLLMARPSDALENTMIHNAQTVGGEIALETGVRPKGESREPVLVSHWKPKEDVAANDTPNPPVVEEAAEEPAVEEAPQTDDAESKDEPESEDSDPELAKEPEAPAEEENTADESTGTETPVTEEVIAEEPKAEEPAEPEVPAEEPKAEEPAEPEAPAEEPKAEAPKKTSIRGRKKSRNRKKPDKE